MAAKNLFDKTTAGEILNRLEHISANSSRKWGTMTASQMLKHMNTAYAVALGSQQLPHSQPLFAMAANPLGRWIMIDILTWPQAMPTAPSFIVKDQPELEGQKSELIKNIRAFLDADPSIKGEHPVFGKMDKATWGKLMYKHTDHHLRQFGC